MIISATVDFQDVEWLMLESASNFGLGYGVRPNKYQNNI